MLNDLSELLRTLFLLVSDWVICGSTRKRGGGLVQIRLDAIGDFILSLNCAKEIRMLYPTRRITLIANAAWADIAEQLPYWDKVWSVRVEGRRARMPTLLDRWRLLRKIRYQGFDIAIHPIFSRNFFTGDSLVRATGAAERIGSTGDFSNIRPWQKAISDRWYTRLLSGGQGEMHELQRTAEFLRQLGVKDYVTTAPRLPEVASLGPALSMDAPYFIIFPGASSSARKWPIAEFCTLIRALQLSTGWRPVLCGSQNEHELCTKIAEQVSLGTSNFAGQTSLPEFAEVVRRACLLVGNETSAVHIAAAVGTPSVCILGGGHFGRFVPYPECASECGPVAVFQKMQCFGCNWHCTQPHSPGGPVPCISSVTVDAVIAAVNRAVQLKGGLVRDTRSNI